MRQMVYDKVDFIAEKYRGYIDTESLMREGFTNRQIGLLTAEGKLEKVAHGRYWIISPKYRKPKTYKAVEAAFVNPNAIICADSACYYQGLIDVEPEALSIATRRGDRHKMKMNFPVNRHYFSDSTFEEGQKRIKTKFGVFTAYDIDRSVCDCIRFKDSIDRDIFEQIIKNYRESTKVRKNRLTVYAKNLRVLQQLEEAGL